MFNTAKLLATVMMLGTALPAWAEDQGGTLNPEELTLDAALERARSGRLDWLTCAQGYWLTKQGRHDASREIFHPCAEGGNTQSMTWMSYMEQNGFGGGGVPDFDAAADWDRRAAEGDDEVGMFNHALNLLMGRGVEKDPEKAKQLIDDAAERGLRGAIWLQRSGYRVEEVIPDADHHTIPSDGTGF